LSCSQVLLPLISIPYVSRVLLPEGIGQVNFIDSLSYYFVTIAEFGIVVYGIREVGRTRHDQEKLRKLVSELVVLHCITSAISLLIYGICVYLLWQKIQDIRLVFFSVSFLLANFFACEWYFWGLEKFKYITIRSLISRMLAVVSIFILIKQPPDYYIYYGIIVITTMINLVSNTVVLFKQLPLTLKQLNLLHHIRHTSIIWLISLFYCIQIMLDNVLLGLVSTTAAVGIYAFSMKIVRLSSNVLTDMFLVLYPRTIMLIKEQKKNELQQLILKSVQLIILVSVPACLAVFLLSEPLVKVFFGKNFQSIHTNLKILAIFPFARAYGMFLSKQILISFDKEKLYLYSLITGSLFFVMATLILSSRLHDQGACYAITITEILVMSMNYYHVKRTVPDLKVFDWRTLLQAISGSILLIPVIMIIPVFVTSNILVLILAAAVCIPVYFIFQIFVCKNRLLATLFQTLYAKIR
jgi:O-antigen/teichoic acid export membrane protein